MCMFILKDGLILIWEPEINLRLTLLLIIVYSCVFVDNHIHMYLCSCIVFLQGLKVVLKFVCVCGG